MTGFVQCGVSSDAGHYLWCSDALVNFRPVAEAYKQQHNVIDNSDNDDDYSINENDNIDNNIGSDKAMQRQLGP